MSDTKSQDKAERLKAALKENLKRRKAQARGRQAAKSSGTESGSLSVSGERDKASD
ncbi:hypothetical protein [Microvirga subterranea]|uniref:hypothetical protein n=1 Tax=Microvirga subterranea TaxID=186651 RepID=UPI001570B7F6|nr:hypothetical protein [Microvirga subterranea]